MDAIESEEPSTFPHLIVREKQTLAASPAANQRHCSGDASLGEFFLSANPSIVLHVLTNHNLIPDDLARLEATCKFFRQPADFHPDKELSLAELAALDMCEKRSIFRTMAVEERKDLKGRCGGSWKLVLGFLMAGENCFRREKSQAIAGAGHSLAITSKGGVYSFGANSSGQLGHGTTADDFRPRLIKSLAGIRITHAAAGIGRTMLISDVGQVYAFGIDCFGEPQFGAQGNKLVTTPQLVESLKDVFVVQAAIGNFFTAVLSREGRVYTFSWGDGEKLGHLTEPADREPRQLMGPLEFAPVVQISAGYCYLLALACRPDNAMSVYSVGCGLGGKLGHGTRADDTQPRLIHQFEALKFQPVAISAGAWHAAVLGRDGRVCTWGWGRHGCLGHGNEDCELVPRVVEALGNVRAVHVAAGDYTTFVVSDEGDVYSFGCSESLSLGHNAAGAAEQDAFENADVMWPTAVATLKENKERVLQISPTSSNYWNPHTLALTEAGRVYGFGGSDTGQLGVGPDADRNERPAPGLVDVDLS